MTLEKTSPHYASEAYHTGFEAREQGEPRYANPYGIGTWDSDEWFDGWDDATQLAHSQ